MTPDIDLHALANAPYAGTAAQVLTAAGLMLPDTPEGHTFFRVKVSVTVSKTAEIEIVVAAPSAASAKAHAEEYGDEFADGLTSVSWETDETEATAHKVDPLTPAQAAKEAARLRQPIEVAE